jgi:uncharacterized delta-60 repeat protein
MTVYAKTSTGYPAVAPYAQSSGVWRQAKELHVKRNGTWRQIYLSGGLLDTSVTYRTATGSMSSIAVQSDDKIIIMGGLTIYDGALCKRLIRLNKDLSIDTTFLTNLGTGFSTAPNSSVLPNRIAIQSDGKIILVGTFTSFNGSTVGRIVRLNADGTKDTTFITNTGTGANAEIYGVFVDSNNKILIYGNFTSFNGVSKNRLYRLNSDGTADTTFNTNIGTASSTGIPRSVIHIPGSTDYFLSGSTTVFNGSTVARAVALNNDGTLYTTFNTNLGTSFNGTVSGAIADETNIVAYGSFTSFNGNASRAIVRLSNLGVYDATLPAISWNLAQNANPQIDAMYRHSNGKISARMSGYITGYTTNSSLSRLNSDWTLDTRFMTNASSTMTTLYGVGINPNNDKLVLGGVFTSYAGQATTLANLAVVGGDPGY